MKNVQVLARKVLDMVSEIETYSFYKQNLVKSLKQLFDDYQAGKHTYFQYEKAQKKLLKGKTKEEWISYYNSYILSLMKRVEAYNSQIFYEAYSDRGYLKIEEAGPVPKPAPSKPAPARPARPPLPKEIPTEIRKEIPLKKKLEIEAMPLPEMAPPPKVRPEKAEVEEIPAKLVEVKPSVMDKVSLFFKRVFARKEIKEQLAEIKAKPAKPAPAKPAEKEEAVEFIKKKHIPSAKDKKVKPSAGVAMGHFFGIDYIRNLLSRRKIASEEKPSEVPFSTIQLETLRRKAKPEITAQIEKITATALTKEAHRIRSIMERRKALKVYQPSFFGSLANVAIRRVSLYLLDAFPEFFKDLYHALRLANIKVLSNTYVNMLVLGVSVSMVLGLVIFGVFFASTGLPFLQVIFRTLMMSVLAGLATFAGFYAYPYSKMKQRRRSINTNLPFAINHMAAVSASGVAPVRMFKLISESKEYGEVSVEIEKIVNYIEIFGYDVLTALRAVASTTPSYQFKDFFEGMISNTQTGGDLKQYFSQKAEEAMMNYKLERQKYTETISTYSDIYTGILIAAPLFFVAALSLVSLLGGKVGGLDVNIVIVIGTYIIIPLMNVSFLAFLEITQPEI
ncbi:type II secretion system F family protein [Candidatus Woesearchaeota archaeon]|jgi:flagellar protein FlaJ|nr:type II secretion system F family protein [Candidatus Woesearchaeota archaeon]